jgi:hypothetical protein
MLAEICGRRGYRERAVEEDPGPAFVSTGIPGGGKVISGSPG